MFNRDEWLAGLKVGDRIIISQTFGQDRVSSIKRVTATQIIIGFTESSDRRFRRVNGREVGAHGYDKFSLEPATQESLAKIEIKKRRNYLSALKWHELPDEIVFHVYDLIRKQDGKGKE